MTNSVMIGKRSVGFGEKCFIIAEAGVNHNGDLNLAFKLIEAAAKAGADAVKFQTFAADRLAGNKSPKAAYQKKTTSTEESQHAMLKKLELSPEMHFRLLDHCNAQNILFLSSPFDEQASDLLDSLDVAAFKVPSGEIVNLPYLKYLGTKARPIILSTGMSTLEEVTMAVETICSTGNNQIVILHCLSDYPADAAQANLRAIITLSNKYGYPVGFSDHTEGQVVAIAAVALGACVIERHFTLDRNLPGPDHLASLEPDDLAEMIKNIRITESALGNGNKEPQPGELNNRLIIRKSIVAARDLPINKVIVPGDLSLMRPGTGLPPQVLPELIGRRLLISIVAGTLIHRDMLA